MQNETIQIPVTLTRKSNAPESYPKILFPVECSATHSFCEKPNGMPAVLTLDEINEYYL